MVRVAFYFILLLACTACNQNPKLSQYTVQGERLYEKNCSNCHQTDGSGLGRLYPPLKGSEYLKKTPAELAEIIRIGMKGSIQVQGKEYNQPMAGNPSLTDLEIAEILTYINVTWGDGSLVDVKAVSQKINP